MLFRGRPRPDPERPRVGDLPARRAERRQHRLDSFLRPLSHFVQEQELRSRPVQPPGIGAEHPEHRPGAPVRDARPVARILNPPPAARPDPVSLEQRPHERLNVAEADRPLLEARSHNQRFSHRLRERPIERSAREPRDERRFPVPPRHRERRIPRPPERPSKEPPLPRKHLERLPVVASLRHLEAGQVGRQLTAHRNSGPRACWKMTPPARRPPPRFGRRQGSPWVTNPPHLPLRDIGNSAGSRPALSARPRRDAARSSSPCNSRSRRPPDSRRRDTSNGWAVRSSNRKRLAVDLSCSHPPMVILCTECHARRLREGAKRGSPPAPDRLPESQGGSVALHSLTMLARSGRSLCYAGLATSNHEGDSNAASGSHRLPPSHPRPVVRLHLATTLTERRALLKPLTFGQLLVTTQQPLLVIGKNRRWPADGEPAMQSVRARASERRAARP